MTQTVVFCSRSLVISLCPPRELLLNEFLAEPKIGTLSGYPSLQTLDSDQLKIQYRLIRVKNEVYKKQIKLASGNH